MTYRANGFASVAVAFITAGVMSLAAQDDEEELSKCSKANTQTLQKCMLLYTPDPYLYTAKDLKNLKKSAEVADYNTSDSCGDVESLLTNTKAGALKGLGIANDKE